MRRNRAPRILATGFALVALLVSAGGETRAGEEDGCYRVHVPEPFVLPDGSLHPPAVLQICSTRRLSPVEWVHAAYLDGVPMGRFLARVRSGRSALPPGEARIVFRRDTEGLLELDELALSAAGGTHVHRFVPAPSFAVAKAARREAAPAAVRASDPAGTGQTIAARRDPE